MFHQLRIARRLCAAGVILTVSGATLGLLGATTLAVSVGPGFTGAVSNAPYSTAGQTCDPNRNGYHFIMNQLVYPEGAVINAADFGPINITFSDGSTAVATFTDLAGGQTAHFLNSTVDQTGNFTITSATMIFPAGTDITSFGGFVISHPPCGTTTTNTTTTVVPSTTTTVVPSNTSTSLVLAEAPFLPTTTTLVASQALVATTAAARAGSLPATGTNARWTAMLGLFVLSCGLMLVGLGRRRTVQS